MTPLMSEHPIHISGNSVWNKDEKKCEAAAPEPTNPQTRENCFRDNTAYYGHNLNDFRNTRVQNTIQCQQRCQDWNGGGTCRFWSFDKLFGKCHLKDSMEGEEYAITQYGDVHENNNDNYASGSRDCPTVVC